MKFASFGEYKFCVGMRVAFKPRQDMEYYYGTVVGVLSEDKLKVLSDYKNRFFAVPTEYVVPVLKWNRDDAGHSLEELHIDNRLPHEQVGKEMMKMDVIVLFSMWLYANHLIFGGKLKAPAIKLNGSLKYLGLCHSTALNGEPTLIEISKRTISSANAFGTMVHEMVHQFNFEIAWKDKKAQESLKRDGHGEYFTMWQAPIFAKTGVKIEQFADINDINFNVDLTKSTRRSKKRQFYAIVDFQIDNGTHPLYFLTRFLDNDDAMADYVTFQDYNFRQDFLDLLLERGVKPKMTQAGAIQPLFEKLYKTPYKKNYVMKNSRIRFFATTNTLLAKLYQISMNVGKSMDFDANVEEMKIKATTFSPLTQKQYDALIEGDKLVAEISYGKVEKKWDMTVMYEDKIKDAPDSVVKED